MITEIKLFSLIGSNNINNVAQMILELVHFLISLYSETSVHKTLPDTSVRTVTTSDSNEAFHLTE